MKCPRCGGSGKYMREIGGYRPCEYCNGMGEITQTNEDWFIMLSTEEKARFIAMFSLRRKCVNEGEFYESVKNSLINASELPEMPMILRKDIEEWLKDKREINVEGGKKHHESDT